MKGAKETVERVCPHCDNTVCFGEAICRDCGRGALCGHSRVCPKRAAALSVTAEPVASEEDLS
jgi:predicted amidophosphoribosyltransferase